MRGGCGAEPSRGLIQGQALLVLVAPHFPGEAGNGFMRRTVRKQLLHRFTDQIQGAASLGLRLGRKARCEVIRQYLNNTGPPTTARRIEAFLRPAPVQSPRRSHDPRPWCSWPCPFLIFVGCISVGLSSRVENWNSLIGVDIAAYFQQPAVMVKAQANDFQRVFAFLEKDKVVVPCAQDVLIVDAVPPRVPAPANHTSAFPGVRHLSPTPAPPAPRGVGTRRRQAPLL